MSEEMTGRAKALRFRLATLQWLLVAIALQCVFLRLRGCESMGDLLAALAVFMAFFASWVGVLWFATFAKDAKRDGWRMILVTMCIMHLPEFGLALLMRSRPTPALFAGFTAICWLLVGLALRLVMNIHVAFAYGLALLIAVVSAVVPYGHFASFPYLR